MRTRSRGGLPGIALPTLACSLACGGAVVVLSVCGLLPLDGASAAPVPAPAAAPVLAPPARVAVRIPPAPAVTPAPTAPQWTARLAPAHR